jgi:hypothetical protein
MGMPFVWLLGFDVTVEFDEDDEDDEVEDTDDEEFVRWRVLRCMNMLMPRASSDGFIEPDVCPPLTVIHPGRLRFAKLGGFATAVMGMARREMGEAPGGRGQWRWRCRQGQSGAGEFNVLVSRSCSARCWAGAKSSALSKWGLLSTCRGCRGRLCGVVGGLALALR